MSAHMMEDRIRVLVFVQTAHEHRLEFVLRAAEERNNKDEGFYEKQLFDALQGALKALPHEAYAVVSSVYGNISYDIEVADYQEWQHTRGAVEQTIKRWKSKYAIDRMAGE